MFYVTVKATPPPIKPPGELKTQEFPSFSLKIFLHCAGVTACPSVFQTGPPVPLIVASGSQRSAVLHLIFSIQTEILYLWFELKKGSGAMKLQKPQMFVRTGPTARFPRLPQQAGQVFTSCDHTSAPASHHTTGGRLTWRLRAPG